MPESPKSSGAAIVVIVVGLLLLVPCVGVGLCLGLFGLRAAPRVGQPAAQTIETPPLPLEESEPVHSAVPDESEIAEPAAESKIENVRIVGDDQVLADVSLDANDELVFFWVENEGGAGLPAPGHHEFIFQLHDDGKFSVKLGPRGIGPADWIVGYKGEKGKFQMRESVEESQWDLFPITLYTFGDVTMESGEKYPVGIRIHQK